MRYLTYLDPEGYPQPACLLDGQVVDIQQADSSLSAPSVKALLSLPQAQKDRLQQARIA
jgi:hypothetical protein